jgi:transposase InsO family protein
VAGPCAQPAQSGEFAPDQAENHIAPNHLQRAFQAGVPNQKWVADFTYIWTAKGWLYVAVVLDLYSRLAGSGQTSTRRRPVNKSDGLKDHNESRWRMSLPQDHLRS